MNKLQHLSENYWTAYFALYDYAHTNKQAIIDEYNNTHKNTIMSEVYFLSGRLCATITDKENKILTSFAEYDSEKGWHDSKIQLN